MYNKHTCTITMYGVVLDNKVSVQFNTEKKRKEFIEKVKNRTVTYISNVAYPWNPDDGKHNLMSLEEFSEHINVPLNRVERAVKNGYLQIEHINDIPHVVNANDRFRIKGITHVIRNPVEKKGMEIMPLSKNGKLYYTEDQAKRAYERNNAFEYARSQGYDLIPKGKDFTMRDHTSMVFTEDGWWHWNGRNLHGRAIEFIMFYEDGLLEKQPEYLKKAIIKLAGENVQTNTPRPEKAAAPEPQSPPKPFVLPEPNSDHKRAFAYLTKSRGIDPDIVSQLMKEKKIFESKDRHNAVFAFQNNNGETNGAFLRGTSTDPKYQFKGMAAGSDRADSYFSFGGSKTASVACVFEASIDALSYASLQKLSGNTDLTQRYYVATGGAGDSNFLSFLKGHPEVKNVILCQDNDEAGNKFAKDLGDKLRGMGYQVSRCLPKGKDFNEELQKEKALDKPAQQEAAPGPRRYEQNGERLWNGKTPGEFTRQDTRRFLDGMESMQDDLGLYEAMAREQEYMQRELLSEDDFSVLGD